MAGAAEPLVRYDLDGGVATLTLNRPDRFNAISPDLAAELAALLVVVDDAPDVRCVVLTGAGRGFCSGGDLGRLAQEGAEPSRDPAAEHAAQVAARKKMHEEIPLRLHRLSKPTLAIVNGAAAGAGFSLALACDLRVAASTAKLTTGFAKVGRSGDFGGTFFLTRLVGPSRSRELYFTSEVVTADRALELGLVDHVHPREDAVREGLALAARIAAGPPGALARMKAAFHVAEAGDLRELLELEAELQTQSGLGEEGQEFLAGFLAARER